MKLASLCYVRQGGKTLMVLRNKKENDVHQGKWNGLGGKFEPGETPEECARREIREEAGLEVTTLELKGILTFPGFAHGEDWYAFVFLAHGATGELIDSAEGELRWIDNEQVLALNLWEGDRHFLPLLDQPGFFSGKFVYQNGQLISHHLVARPLQDQSR